MMNTTHSCPVFDFYCKVDDNIAETATLLTVLLILFMIIVFGNSLTLAAIIIDKQLQTVFNLYIVNLAITDISVAFSGVPMWMILEFFGYWPLGNSVCGLFIAVDAAVSYVSSITLVVIAVDRYWAVRWSLHYRNHHGKGKCLLMILFTW